mmetsp:Transcript_1807/g.5618  ORF Transcript_1807/g.5618 Transcript_1807/m.5618 type:complete len:453 (+) Transcript_1807:2655-4013(+)
MGSHTTLLVGLLRQPANERSEAAECLQVGARLSAQTVAVGHQLAQVVVHIPEEVAGQPQAAAPLALARVLAGGRTIAQACRVQDVNGAAHRSKVDRVGAVQLGHELGEQGAEPAHHRELAPHPAQVLHEPLEHVVERLERRRHQRKLTSSQLLGERGHLDPAHDPQVHQKRLHTNGEMTNGGVVADLCRDVHVAQLAARAVPTPRRLNQSCRVLGSQHRTVARQKTKCGAALLLGDLFEADCVTESGSLLGAALCGNSLLVAIGLLLVVLLVVLLDVVVFVVVRHLLVSLSCVLIVGQESARILSGCIVIRDGLIREAKMRLFTIKSSDRSAQEGELFVDALLIGRVACNVLLEGFDEHRNDFDVRHRQVAVLSLVHSLRQYLPHLLRDQTEDLLAAVRLADRVVTPPIPLALQLLNELDCVGDLLNVLLEALVRVLNEAVSVHRAVNVQRC